jgi:GGDEF domain-containing protein
VQAARRLMNLLALLDHSVLNFSILVSMVSLLGLPYPYRNDARAVNLVARWLPLAFRLLQTRFRLVGSFQDFREMALTDKLTGLNNRRRFDEDLKPGQADPAVLLLLDIDHFKAVNDRYGHDFGDRVLAETALLMRENLRPGTVPTATAARNLRACCVTVRPSRPDWWPSGYAPA